MKRVIKFRGRCRETGDWVYGSYVKTAVGLHYIFPQNVMANVIPQWVVDGKTVGQYTSLKDKTGKTGVYQDDVIEIDHGNGHKWREKVIFHRGCFMAGDDNLLINVIEHATVIGSFHDNPELLEVAE